MDAEPGGVRLGHRVDQVAERRAAAVGEIAPLAQVQRRHQARIEAFGALRQRLGEQAAGIDHPARAQPERFADALSFGAPAAGVALQAVDPGVQRQLCAVAFGDGLQRLQVGVAVDDSRARREQGGDPADLGLQRAQRGAVQRHQVVDPAGACVGRQGLEPLALVFLHRHQQLADAPVADAVAGAPGVQAFAAFQAEIGLERAGRVVEAGVDHFGIATGGVATDQPFALRHQYAVAGFGQARGAGQAARRRSLPAPAGCSSSNWSRSGPRPGRGYSRRRSRAAGRSCQGPSAPGVAARSGRPP